MVRAKENANQEVYELMQEVMQEQYQRLLQAGVHVSIVMVSEPGEGSGKPFLQMEGKRVLAFIRKRKFFENPNLGEAILVIDRFLWEHSLDETGRRSLIDHELQHVALCRDKNGKVKKTIYGRPKISLVNHDWEVGIFKAQVGRYGRRGIDFLSLALVLDQTKTILDKHEREEILKGLDNLPVDLVAESSSDSSSEEAVHE